MEVRLRDIPMNAYCCWHFTRDWPFGVRSAKAVVERSCTNTVVVFGFHIGASSPLLKFWKWNKPISYIQQVKFSIPISRMIQSQTLHYLQFFPPDLIFICTRHMVLFPKESLFQKYSCSAWMKLSPMSKWSCLHIRLQKPNADSDEADSPIEILLSR